MANGVKLALKVIFKAIQHLKSRCFLGIKCHWVDEEGRFPFSNNPTMLCNKRCVVFVKYSRFGV